MNSKKYLLPGVSILIIMLIISCAAFASAATDLTATITPAELKAPVDISTEINENEIISKETAILSVVEDYVVNLDANGGTVVDTKFTLDIDMHVSDLPRPTPPANMEFKYWTVAGSEVFRAITDANIADSSLADKTLIARYRWLTPPDVGNKQFQDLVAEFPELYDPVTGLTQPVFNLLGENVIHEEVWIEVPVESLATGQLGIDHSSKGQRDLICIRITRPKPVDPNYPHTADPANPVGVTKVPTFMIHSPYRSNNLANIDYNRAVAINHPNTEYYENPRTVDGILISSRAYGVNPDTSDFTYDDVKSDRLKLHEWPWSDAAYPDDYYSIPASRGAKPIAMANSFSSGATSSGGLSIENYSFARGFAVVQTSTPGNRYSISTSSATAGPFNDGLNTFGEAYEMLAGLAAIKWLNGECRGYKTKDATEEVVAYWANGDVAMSGQSYVGTTQMAIASAGYEPLKAILPRAGLTSMYTYFRANGAVYPGDQAQSEDVVWLSRYDMSRWQDPNFALGEPDRDAYEAIMDRIADEIERETGDYNKFWDMGNWFGQAGRYKAAVLFMQGLDDRNVGVQHMDQLYRALKEIDPNYPIKLLIHLQAHTSPYNWGEGEFLETSHKWLDRFVYGIENGIDTNGIDAWVADNVTGECHTYSTWPADGSEMRRYYFGSTNGGGQLYTDAPASTVEGPFFDQLKYRVMSDFLVEEDPFYNPTVVNDTNTSSTNWWYNKESLIHRAWESTMLFPSAAPISQGSSTIAVDLDELLQHTDARLAFVSKTLTEPLTLSGSARITLDITPDKGVGSISAMIVDLGEATRGYQTTSNVADWQVPGFANAYNAYNRFRYTFANTITQYKVVARASVDVQNPNPSGVTYLDTDVTRNSGFMPPFIFQTVEIEPGESYSYTFTLEPRHYTFREGSRLAVVVYSTDYRHTIRPQQATKFELNLGTGSYIDLPLLSPLPTEDELTVSLITDKEIEIVCSEPILSDAAAKAAFDVLVEGEPVEWEFLSYFDFGEYEDNPIINIRLKEPLTLRSRPFIQYDLGNEAAASLEVELKESGQKATAVWAPFYTYYDALNNNGTGSSGQWGNRGSRGLMWVWGNTDSRCAASTFADGVFDYIPASNRSTYQGATAAGVPNTIANLTSSIDRTVGRSELFVQTAIDSGMHVVVVGNGKSVYTVPEFRELYVSGVTTDWDTRVTIGGNRDNPIVVTTAEDVYRVKSIDDNTYEFMLEFSRLFLELGIKDGWSNFPLGPYDEPDSYNALKRLQAAYVNAKAQNLWPGTIMLDSLEDYYVYGTMVFYETLPESATWQRELFPINTRREMLLYDPQLYQVLCEVHGEWEYHVGSISGNTDSARRWSGPWYKHSQADNYTVTEGVIHPYEPLKIVEANMISPSQVELVFNREVKDMDELRTLANWELNWTPAEDVTLNISGTTYEYKAGQTYIFSSTSSPRLVMEYYMWKTLTLKVTAHKFNSGLMSYDIGGFSQEEIDKAFDDTLTIEEGYKPWFSEDAYYRDLTPVGVSPMGDIGDISGWMADQSSSASGRTSMAVSPKVLATQTPEQIAAKRLVEAKKIPRTDFVGKPGALNKGEYVRYDAAKGGYVGYDKNNEPVNGGAVRFPASVNGVMTVTFKGSPAVSDWAGNELEAKAYTVQMKPWQTQVMRSEKTGVYVYADKETQKNSLLVACDYWDQMFSGTYENLGQRMADGFNFAFHHQNAKTGEYLTGGLDILGYHNHMYMAPNRRSQYSAGPTVLYAEGLGYAVCSSMEYSLLRDYQYTRYMHESIMHHEGAHSVEFPGMFYFTDLNFEVHEIWNILYAANTWRNAYPNQNSAEWFGTLSTQWFGTQRESVDGTFTGVWTAISTREEIYTYDPLSYQFMKKVYYNGETYLDPAKLPAPFTGNSKVPGWDENGNSINDNIIKWGLTNPGTMNEDRADWGITDQFRWTSWGSPNVWDLTDSSNTLPGTGRRYQLGVENPDFPGRADYGPNYNPYLLSYKYKTTNEVTVSFPGVTGVSVQYYSAAGGWVTLPGTFDNSCVFLPPTDVKITSISAIKGGMYYQFDGLTVGAGLLNLDVPVVKLMAFGISAECNIGVSQDDWVYRSAPALVGEPNYYYVFDNGKDYKVQLYRPGFYPITVTAEKNDDYYVSHGASIWAYFDNFYSIEVPIGVTNVWISSYDWAVRGANAGDLLALLMDPNSIRDAKMSYIYNGATCNVDFKLDGADPFADLRINKGITVNFPGIEGAQVRYYTNVSNWITVGTFNDGCNFEIQDQHKATWGTTTVQVLKGGMWYTFSGLEVGEDPLVLDVPLKKITLTNIIAACNLGLAQEDWVYRSATATVGEDIEYLVFDNNKGYIAHLVKPGSTTILIPGIIAGDTVDLGTYF